MGEVDQEGKAVAMNGRNNLLPYQVPILNTIAARHVREDFIHFMTKHVPDFFKEDGHAQIKKMVSHSDKLCIAREQAYIDENCSEFEVPLFDIPTNAHSFDWCQGESWVQ